MAKPGVMFYFDIRPCIRRLSLEDKGQLFESILDYAENDVEPELDGALGVAWDFIQPRIDRDSEQYEQKTEKSKYAAFTRELRKQGHDAITFDDWKALPENARYRMISGDGLEASDDIGRYPTTTSTTTSTILSCPSAKPPRLSDENFEAFWEAYPRKESKAAAKKAFAKAGAPLDILLQALETQKQSDQWQRNGGQYIPYASTWLNQKRWEDELPAQTEQEASARDWTQEHPEWLDPSNLVCGPDGMYRPKGVSA